MLKEVWEFVKNPVYKKLGEHNGKEKKRVFFNLLKWILIFSFALAFLSGMLSALLGLEHGDHALEEFMAEYSAGMVFFMAVLLAPLIEELVFRGPLVFFRNSKYFKYVFYASALLFGAVHILNFDVSKPIIWLAPFLIAPQIAAGIFLGFIRVKMGLIWSILLHATFNCILVVPLLLVKTFQG